MTIPKQALGARRFLGPVLASGQPELSTCQAAQPRNTRRVESTRGINRVRSGYAGCPDPVSGYLPDEGCKRRIDGWNSTRI